VATYTGIALDVMGVWLYRAHGGKLSSATLEVTIVLSGRYTQIKMSCGS
jgi:hypothetical protein